jgi:hypothetical protein
MITVTDSYYKVNIDEVCGPGEDAQTARSYYDRDKPPRTLFTFALLSLMTMTD